MKIAIGGMKQETNCFSSVPTPKSSWGTKSGDEILAMRGTKGEIGGALEVADKYGWEILPTFFASTRPSQPTDEEAFQWIKENILAPIRAHKDEIDGVIMCFHGAMMAPETIDPEGDVASEIRKIIGDKPFMITLDLHANNTEKLARSVDAVFACDTNPHIDFYERGIECAECMAKTLSGEIHPVTAHRHPPLILPTINMLSAHGPLCNLIKRGEEWEKKEGVINVSVCGGFPYVDAEYAGLNIIATTDGDRALAQEICDDIATMAWETREEFIKTLLSIEDSIAAAKETLAGDPELPVILADVSDNSGGGGSSDTTMLMRAVLEADLPGSAVGCIWDPETVQKALEVGIGNTGKFSIGGRFHDYGEPVEVEAVVRAITDGTCRCYGPMGRGDKFSFGNGVRLQVGNVHICVYARRNACNYREIFSNLGIDPARQKLLLIKSRGHFRANFQPISSRIIEVDAPGAVNPDIRRYNYKHANAWPINPSVQQWKAR